MNDQLARPSFPRVIWFTGLSGSGKSTIADLVDARLTRAGWRVTTLDGDAVRARYPEPLGFSPADIRENNRRIAELCVEALATSDVVLVPVISPFRDARAAARRRIGDAFLEAYVRAALPTVIERDPKGLYAEAMAGRRPAMIGMRTDVPYEPPEEADLVLDTEVDSAEVLAGRMVTFLQENDR